MYIPRAFAEDDQNVLFDLIERYNFGCLVTVRAGLPVATHLPFMLDRRRGERGTLVAHLARANDQWQDFAAGAEALAIFQGSHAYISPAWYHTAPNVPTWNYMVAHAYGVPRVVSDEARVEEILRCLIAQEEGRIGAPWDREMPERYFDGMARGVVVFELPIARLEGKSKLNQNHPEENRAGVVQALEGSADPGEREIARVMRGWTAEAEA